MERRSGAGFKNACAAVSPATAARSATIASGQHWFVLPGAKTSLKNKSKVTAIDTFWEIELE